MTAELKQTARVVWHKWPCFALAIGLAIYTYVAVRSGGSLTDVEKLPALDRAINATHSFFLYPWRWLVPLGLSPLYPLDFAGTRLTPANLAWVKGLLGVWGACVVAGCQGADRVAWRHVGLLGDDWTCAGHRA